MIVYLQLSPASVLVFELRKAVLHECVVALLEEGSLLEMVDLLRGFGSRMCSSLIEEKLLRIKGVSKGGAEVLVHFEEVREEVLFLFLRVDQIIWGSTDEGVVRRPSPPEEFPLSFQKGALKQLRRFPIGLRLMLAEEEVLALLKVQEPLVLFVEEGAVDSLGLELELLHGLLVEMFAALRTGSFHV